MLFLFQINGKRYVVGNMQYDILTFIYPVRSDLISYIVLEAIYCIQQIFIFYRNNDHIRSHYFVWPVVSCRNMWQILISSQNTLG